jgi:hypothetical protein
MGRKSQICKFTHLRKVRKSIKNSSLQICGFAIYWTYLRTTVFLQLNHSCSPSSHFPLFLPIKVATSLFSRIHLHNSFSSDRLSSPLPPPPKKKNFFCYSCITPCIPLMMLRGKAREKYNIEVIYISFFKFNELALLCFKCIILIYA